MPENRVKAEAATTLAMAQGMLSWRMRHAERRLSSALVTPEGIVGHYG